MAEEHQLPGLAHNPFASPGPAFFQGGDRRTYLEQLRHLSQWSRRVLLVTGAHDAGKSVLFRQLSATLEPRAKAARINGALINASREVLAGIAQGFGLAAPADAHVQLLMDVIVAHVDDQQSAQRFCVVLVDDAELLEARALEQLLILVSRCPIRLVLFAEVRIVPVVERLAKRLDVGWHELRLSGLSLADLREYLEWRFKQARYRGRLPFTEQQVREIARISQGMPGRINQAADALLTRMQSGEVIAGRAGFPLLHKAILGFLVLTTLVVYLLWTPLPEEPNSVVTQNPPAKAPRFAPSSDISPAESPRVLSGDGPRDEVVESIAEGDTAVGEVERSFAPAAEEIALAADGTSADAASGLASQPIRDADSAMESLEETAAAPAAGSVGNSAAVESQTPAAEVAAPARQNVPAGPRDAAWIMAQPENRFTLQLISSSSAERAAAYVAQRGNSGDFAIYRLHRSGKTFHVVIYGSYGSRAEAERAAAMPATTAGGVEPWVRTFAEVQGAVRTGPQG